MKKLPLTPVQIGGQMMIPVSRFYSLLSVDLGKRSVRLAITEGVTRFGAVFQGETDVRFPKDNFGRPLEVGNCNFLVPFEAVNAFNAHWDAIAAHYSLGRTA
jgi:hypothetical protein